MVAGSPAVLQSGVGTRLSPNRAIRESDFASCELR